MSRRLITVLVAAAIAAAGCGGGDGNGADRPGTATSSTEAPAPTTALDAATTVDAAPATTTTAAAPSVTAAAPTAAAAGTRAEPAPEPPAAAARPDGAYFALERVLDISIEMASSDWDALRRQTRTFEDLIAEIEEYDLSQPFAGIYTWFSGTVTVDGETHAEVGVRKKGFLGSQSETKPSLKLRFDKYVDDQSLGGVMERMTLNNSVQDPSMINTCLSYRVFAATGNPAPRCNFATVSVNGKRLGLHVHVEEIKKPFLRHHFGSGQGNLYEGTISDFVPEYRGTIEKKTNEDADDWSDIDAVVASLQDPSPAGLDALGEVVDLDRFLSFWATEVLVGHWDGYAGNRNNYQFYREPGGRFVFIPWGPDATFQSGDDPNPFDDVSDPPPSVLALTAIPNRLYNDPGGRADYVSRLSEILDTVWDEDELLAVVDEMAAIVARHALPEARADAATDTDRVRKFILKRRGEILADLIPVPPDWPEPEPPFPVSGTLEVTFETTWGSNLSPDPLGQGTVHSLLLDGAVEPAAGIWVVAGRATPDESALLAGIERPASITIAELSDDGSVGGTTLVVDPDRLVAGATLVIGTEAIAGGAWWLSPGASEPDWFAPFTDGTLELSSAATTPGAVIAGTFSGAYGSGTQRPGTYAPSAYGRGTYTPSSAAAFSALSSPARSVTTSDRVTDRSGE